jgi:Holliday junction resolvase RusA-like endonuclease
LVGSFWIDGEPVSQVRHSMTIGKNGRPRAFYKSKKYAHGKMIATNQIRIQMIKNMANRFIPMGVPILVKITYFFPRPKRLKTKKSNPDYIPHTVKPDIDNLDKLYLDSLSGIAFHDDNQVFKIESIKVFTTYDHKTKAEGRKGVKIAIMAEQSAEIKKAFDRYLPF